MIDCAARGWPAPVPTLVPKILVERPRPPSRVPRGRDGRKFRDHSDAAFLPMKAGYRDPKSLNENLRPLARYLARQVGRPWDKVYSEMRAVIDGHVLGLGTLYFGVQRVWQPLYVDPRTGLLRRNPDDISWRRKYRERQLAKERQRARVWRDVSLRCQLHQVNGCWFQVEVTPLPPPPAIRWDALRSCPVNARTNAAHRRMDDQFTAEMYGRAGVYAVSKRQLSAREIRAYGLGE